MASAVFVHVSDIHFGQERGERVHIHKDVRDQVVADAGRMVRTLPEGAASGILVTGDVAHSGGREEYAAAGVWLDELSRAVGCRKFSIQIVPGNHDLDRGASSLGSAHVLDVIRKGGADEYEAILANEMDRKALFARFDNYDRFCAGYDCALDEEGRYSDGIRVELAPGRAMRFVRINSSLLCTGSETELHPELMVGPRQFTLRPTMGEEIVVLIHHPLSWCRDGGDALRYLRSRARVMISGHEHLPGVGVEQVEPGCDFLRLAAGATVPYRSDDAYTFTYNLITFDWEKGSDALAVTVHPRAWNPSRTRFEPDHTRLGGDDPRFVLGSPNFREAGAPLGGSGSSEGGTCASPGREPPRDAAAPAEPTGGHAGLPRVEAHRGLLLRFFRDLTEGERLRILVSLGALDGSVDEPLTRSLERSLFEWLIGQGRAPEMERMVQACEADPPEGDEP